MIAFLKLTHVDGRPLRVQLAEVASYWQYGVRSASAVLKVRSEDSTVSVLETVEQIDAQIAALPAQTFNVAVGSTTAGGGA